MMSSCHTALISWSNSHCDISGRCRSLQTFSHHQSSVSVMLTIKTCWRRGAETQQTSSLLLLLLYYITDWLFTCVFSKHTHRHTFVFCACIPSLTSLPTNWTWYHAKHFQLQLCFSHLQQSVLPKHHEHACHWLKTKLNDWHFQSDHRWLQIKVQSSDLHVSLMN